MKKIILSFILLFSISIVNSQYYYIPSGTGTNPGNLNTDDEYPVGSGLAAGWTSILSGSNSSPVYSPSQTIPFSFNFNGGAVTNYKVSSSGVLTFSNSSTVPAYASVSLPSSSIPDSSVCILGLKGTGSNDNIVTKTFGTAPNR